LKLFSHLHKWIIPIIVSLFSYNRVKILVFSKNNMRAISKSKTKKIAESTVDMYTKEILKQQYEMHKNYVLSRKNSSNILNIQFRLPCIPEDISENMIKFIIQKTGDNTCTWNCKGDLLSSIEGKQECKCFTSTGPISFTPSSEWDSIYFLDATEWLNDYFKLYKFPYKRTSDEWKNIKVNKNQTFEDQSLQGRRPRVNWHGLYPQIKEKCCLVFEGSFEDIVLDCSDE